MLPRPPRRMLTLLSLPHARPSTAHGGRRHQRTEESCLSSSPTSLRRMPIFSPQSRLSTTVRLSAWPGTSISLPPLVA